jgi:hypothetical protein
MDIASTVKKTMLTLGVNSAVGMEDIKRTAMH